MGSCRHGWAIRWAGQVSGAVLVVALLGGAPARAAEVETREFLVLVDGKEAGKAQMTINKQDEGSYVMSCDTDVHVRVLLVNYTYSYRGREEWKDGRLVRFASTGSDDGKRFDVAAAAEGEKLRIRANNQERVVRGDVWLSSYWKQPAGALVDTDLTIIDCDTGRELTTHLNFVGEEQRVVGRKNQNVRHFQLKGKTAVELWYDADGRLVRQEWVEEGHNTVLELANLRR
jgi:hypothetical protein